MSIRMLAKELYAARQREESLSNELAKAKEASASGMADPSGLADALRRARAERQRMEAILAGHIDREPKCR